MTAIIAISTPAGSPIDSGRGSRNKEQRRSGGFGVEMAVLDMPEVYLRRLSE